MTALELVFVLAAFMVVDGFMTLIVGRAVRDGLEDSGTVTWIIVLTLAFVGVSLRTLELVLPRLEKLLL